MPGQRKKGIARVSLTLEEELLQEIESHAQLTDQDRLQVIRTAIKNHLKAKGALPRKRRSKS